MDEDNIEEEVTSTNDGLGVGDDRFSVCRDVGEIDDNSKENAAIIVEETWISKDGKM